MKLGINLLCLTDHVTTDHLPALRRLKELGYDGVEIPTLKGEPSHFAWLGRELDTIGLRRTCTAIVPDPAADPVNPDPSIRARGRAHLEWALDCAIALGAESLGGPIHAPIGHFTGSGPTESELAFGIEAHRELAMRAAANGLYLSVEALNRFETYFLNTMEQCAAYAKRVDHPAFRIMYDTFHANIEERDPVAAVATIAPYLGVVHIAENDRGIPGRGHIDFAATLRAVRQSGYEGWVTIEAFGASLPEIAAATRVWRPLFPDYETLYAESASFIRKTWAEAA